MLRGHDPEADGSATRREAAMETGVHARARDREVTHDVRCCHEHRCPTCGLAWGHSDRVCGSGGEFWLACPICRYSVVSEMDSLFTDEVMAGGTSEHS